MRSGMRLERWIRNTALLLCSVSTTLVSVGLVSVGLVSAGTWFEEQTLVHDSKIRYFRYFLPDAPPPIEGRPLLFILHGGGGDMRTFLDNGTHAEWPEIADETGVLLIVPNGINAVTGDAEGDDQHWNDCRGDAPLIETGADDVGFISALIDWADANHPIDLNRVYATGSSNGGMMTYRLAFELGERIAAIAPFIASLPASSECRSPAHPIPVFICNGEGEDNYVPWNGGCVTQQWTCERGTVLSALATRDYWIDLNHADPAVEEHVNYPDLDPLDETTAESDLYTGGFEGSEVIFYTIVNGGHVTPSIEHRRSRLLLALLGLGRQNHDIEGSREAWAFLSRHRLRGEGRGTSPGIAGLLRLDKNEATELVLEWGGDCGRSTSYGIYRGDLLSGYASLVAESGACSISDTRAVIPQGPGKADFFLVVPQDDSSEGGYGLDSAGSQRSAAADPCRPLQNLDACATR